MQNTKNNWLEAAIAGLMPAGITVHADTNAGDFRLNLLPAEQAATEKMVEKRLLEFARGRHCAHMAMHKLGYPPEAVPKGAARQPEWPAKLVGTISHTHQFAAASVASADDYAGIGLDLEGAEPLDTAMAKLICRPDEPLHDGAVAKQLFGMKEAIYKAIYPSVQRYVDFQEMGVSINAADGTFRAEPHLTGTTSAELKGLTGRFTTAHGLLICCAWLPRQ